MSARTRQKQTPPALEKNPLQQDNPKLTFWIMAVMVAVLLSVTAMCGLGVYLMDQKGKGSDGAPPQKTAPAGDFPKK